MSENSISRNSQIREDIARLENELNIAQGLHMAKMDIGSADEEREASSQVSRLESEMEILRRKLKKGE